jgi:hypothetical protein
MVQPQISMQSTEARPSINFMYLWVEDVEDGGSVHHAVQEDGKRHRGHHNEGAVLRAVDRVRGGVAAVLRAGQQGVPMWCTETL